jgi:hypothetical protein
VGVGTSSPDYPLDVSGDINTNSTLWAQTVALSNTGSVNTYTVNANNPTSTTCNLYTNATGTICIGSSSSKIGIGTTTNTTYTLQVSGQLAATSFNATSDYRIKDNILPLNETFTLDNIKPVTFTNTLLQKQDIGVIAHELQEQYPYLVTGEKDGKDNQTVNYTGFIGILIHEVKQLKYQVKELREEICKLKQS